MIKEYMLDDCILTIIDYRGKTPEKLGGNWTDDGIRVISALNVHNGFIDNEDQIRCVSQEIYNKWMQEEIQRNDCFLASEGASLGENTIWDSDEKVVLGQRLYAIRTNPDILDPWFFAMYMQTDTFRKQVDQVSTGSTVFGISQPVLRALKLLLPDITEQRIIGSIYRNIRQKLIINKSICADLDAMAKQIYDYWFIQYDFPGENGKPYKTNGGKLVYNEELKREIPEGWEVVSFGDCISSINTGLNPRDNFVLNAGGRIRYLTVKNLNTDGSVDFSSTDMIDEDARELVHKRSDIAIGDILFASISPLGRCHLILSEPYDWDINESVFSVKPNYDVMTSVFLYMTFMSEAFIKKAEKGSVGSIFKGIRIAELSEMKTIRPSKPVLDRFDEVVKNLFVQKNNIFAENQQLTELRDFLLPMLMNGQIKIGG